MSLHLRFVLRNTGEMSLEGAPNLRPEAAQLGPRPQISIKEEG